MGDERSSLAITGTLRIHGLAAGRDDRSVKYLQLAVRSTDDNLFAGDFTLAREGDFTLALLDDNLAWKTVRSDTPDQSVLKN